MKLADVQLNFTMRLVTGMLRPTQCPWLPVLSNIEPPALQRTAAVDKLISKAIENTKWDLHNDILCPPRHRLTSRRLLWMNMQPVDTGTQWQKDWQMASVVNNILVSDPAIQLLGFDLSRRQWLILNRFHTDQGHVEPVTREVVCLCLWRGADNIPHSQHPLTKFDGGLQGLSSADADALDWLSNLRP